MSSGPSYHNAMIGLPSTYSGRPQRPPPDSSDYDAYLRQMAASGLPSSTMPSAANSHATTGSHISPNHSIDQHQSAPTLDNTQYGVFEPQTQPGRPYSSFAPLLDRGRPQAQPHQQQQQQQVQGDFVPGTGAGTSDYYQSRVQRPHVQTQHDVSRRSTNQSGYSDHSSSANMSSPVRSGMLPGQTYASPPGSFPAPTGNANASAGYGYQNTFDYTSSGSDAFPSSDPYTSPGMSPEKYMSSPEQIQLAHQHQHMGSIFTTASPTRPAMGMSMGTAGSGGWQPVDSTAGIAPAHSSALGPMVGAGGSGGSHSSGGGAAGGPYSGSSGGYASAHSGSGVAAGVGAGPRQIAGRQAGTTVGRSHSMSGATRPAHSHSHSQSQSGHLAPPMSNKRPRPNFDARLRDRDDGDEESDSDEDGVGGGGTTQGAGVVKRLPGACTNCKRLKMKCVFASGARADDKCQRCQNTGKTCAVEGRKPRQGPNKRELMMRELANKDQIIDSLLRQIHNPAMRTPIHLTPSMPVPQQTANTSDRPPDKDVLAWIESIRQNRPPTPTGSIDTSLVHQRAQSEPPPPPLTEPDEDAVSFGGSASNVREQIEERPKTPAELRQDSAELDETLHSIPPPAAPVGFIAKLALGANRAKRGSDAGMTGEAEEEDKWVGVGNMTYFEAGPSADPELRRIIIERQMPPEILTHGIIKPAEVEVLFKIFFDQLNPYLAILDPKMHTPAFVFGRCPFLFTAICAISSRYHVKRPELYTIAMHFAKQSAATALIDGWKSVELVQAYILMSVYPVPARRWEEDRTWLYLGLAIRMATDLNLHLPWQGKATGEAHEREILNRTRTWLICFNLDRSGATQFGRPPTIREDYIIRKSEDWYKRSKFNMSIDIHLTGYTRLLRIVARFLASVYSDSNSPTALNKNLDFLSLTTASDEELKAFEKETQKQFAEESDHHDSACEYRCNLLPFLANYSRLVIFSFGHQQAFQRGLEQGKVFFDKCYRAASEVVRIAIDILAPSGRLKYAPDGHFVFMSFAAAFLLKMLRPQFAAALEPNQSTRIVSLVTRLSDVLASSAVAIDDRHSPRLYSRFLTGLIAKHTQSGMVLAKPSNADSRGGAGAGGPAGASNGSGAVNPKTGKRGGAGGAGNGLTAGPPNKSAGATEAGMMHESPRATALELEEDEARDQFSSPPPTRLKSPDIVIRAPTIDANLQNQGRQMRSPLGRANASPSHEQSNQDLMAGYVTVDPSGDTISSIASTAQGETTVTDATGGDMDYEDNHDMLAAMYALQDPTFWDSGLLPGFNANFADDASNSSGGARQWYMGQGGMPSGQGAGQNQMGMGMGHQGMSTMPDLFTPGMDYTQGMNVDMDGMMVGYGYR